MICLTPIEVYLLFSGGFVVGMILMALVSMYAFDKSRPKL